MKNSKWHVILALILIYNAIPVSNLVVFGNEQTSIENTSTIDSGLLNEQNSSYMNGSEIENSDKLENNVSGKEANDESFLSSDEQNILGKDEEITEGTSEEITEKSESTSEKSERIAPFVITGEGTETNPYTAANAQELKVVLTTINNDAGEGPYSVQLTADIIYQDSDVFEFYKNVVIDGGGHYMLYSNSSNSAAANTGYRVKTSGLQITLKNMNFGSSTLVDENGDSYSNQTYYGILGAGALAAIQFDAILENITYYGTKGAQPLLTYNRNSTFTFKGENSFTSGAGSSSQEFFEGQNVIFAEGSKTVIDHQTSEGSSLFYNSTTSGASDGILRITLEKNAEVNIISNKTYFTYGSSVILTIGEGADLFYTQEGTDALTFTNSDGYSAEINMEESSKTSFISGAKITSLGTITMNVNAPDYIRFQNTGAATGLFNKNITFNRLDGVTGEIGGYQFSYLDASQELLKQEVAGLSTVTLADNYFDYSSLNQAIYQKKISLVDWESLPDVAINKSNLSTSIKEYAPSERMLTENTFKLSTKQLWSGQEIIDEVSQQEIEDATETTDGIKAIEKSSDLSWNITDLPAGTYYVYVKISGIVNDDPAIKDYLSESLWQEKQIEVIKSPLSVEVPLELIFTATATGPFDESAAPRPIISNSNYPIDFTIDSVEDLSENSPVTLVDQLEAGGENQLVLNLADTKGTILGPLLVGQNRVDSIELVPFLNDPIGIYLKGEYSGPIFKKYHANYTFTYNLIPQGGEG